MPTYFIVRERRYELIHVEDLDWREAREIKRISGMPISQVIVALGEQDPDAWLAIVLICLRRVDPAWQESDLMGESMVKIISTVEEIAEKEPDPMPDPQMPSPSRPGKGGGEASASMTIQDPIGIQAGLRNSG